MDNTSMYRVVGRDGLMGRILNPDALTAPTTSRAIIQFDDGRTAQVPADLLTLRDDETYYLPLGIEYLSAYDEAGDTAFTAADRFTASDTVVTTDGSEMVIPVIREEARISKRQVQGGRVRIVKTVATEEQTVDELLRNEEVEVERLPVDQLVNEAPSTRRDGDTLIIPVVEEVLVVEKRYRVVEEIHVTRRVTERREPQVITLRRENVEVERLDGNDVRMEGQ